MSVLERCPSYRESNKGSKERQGLTLSVRFTEVSVKRESTVDHSAYCMLFLYYIKVNITTNINGIFDQKFKDNGFIFQSSSFVSANRNIDDDTVTSSLQYSTHQRNVIFKLISELLLMEYLIRS